MDKEVVAGVNSIWATSFEAQERRVAVLEQAIVAVVAGTLDEAAREAATHAAHKLAGSLGTFGLEEGSRLAAEVEQAWAASASAAQDVSALAKSVASLRGVLAAHRPPQTDQQAEEPVQVADALDVLLVDDDEVFARYVVDALQRRYRVSWVSTGESALAAIARGAKGSYPKVVLLDIEMPGMKGLKVLEQLAQLGIKGQCAIVMLTRRTIAEDVVRARQLGARDFLAKPISASVLTERVGRALESVR
ncbi:MAG: response regulator [Chloroflexi bacterium]|nr:response regulator [Chloroflexota bacterium]